VQKCVSNRCGTSVVDVSPLLRAVGDSAHVDALLETVVGIMDDCID
jgi:hypothetical protein